jgi:hypothetical protein
MNNGSDASAASTGQPGTRRYLRIILKLCPAPQRIACIALAELAAQQFLPGSPSAFMRLIIGWTTWPRIDAGGVAFQP